MRPSLLVIIMDFLVSSLLLFVGGQSGAPGELLRRAAPHRVDPAWGVAPEFSPAAIQAMEQQWADEYRQQLAEHRVATLSGRSRDLAQSKVTLEQRVTDQSSKLARQDADLEALRAERVRQEESLRQTRAAAEALAREKAALATEKEAARREAAELAAAKAEAEAQRGRLAEQATQLRVRVGQQAETIRVQNETIASQQDILHQELLALVEGQNRLADGQLRIENKAGDLLHGQEGLQTTLGDVQTRQQALSTGMVQVAARIRQMETRQAGPFGFYRHARVTLDVTLKSHRSADYRSSPRMETFRRTMYLPVISAGGRTWLVAHADDLGLHWIGAGETLAEIRYALQPPGATNAAVTLTGPLRLLSAEKRLALLDLRQDPAAAALLASPAAGLRPIALLGPEGLEKRGARDIYLFKRSAEGLGSPVDVSPDLSHPGYLLIRKNYKGWINFIARNLFVSPEAQPEAGDLLIAAEGGLVGMMVDGHSAYLLSTGDLIRTGPPIPLDNPEAFARGSAAAWR